MSRRFKQFIAWEATGGILILIMLVIALLIAHSPLYHWYEQLIETPIQVGVGQLIIHKPAFLWINDGLMAIFFMLLALEMKREILDGELSSRSQITLPLFAAVGGIIFPAGIYYLFNYQHSATVMGWPIPTTTDIAFVLGIISLLGKRVAPSLKAYLVALSIVDDIVAIVIIALVYTGHLSYVALSIAALAAIVALVLNRLGVRRIAPYMMLGVIMWVCMIKSNIHATLAGVVIGFIIPTRTKNPEHPSPSKQLEHQLHPWVSYLILPLFVFANGAVNFSHFTLATAFKPAAIGIILGLFLGKSIGITLFSWFAVVLKLSRLPVGSNWLDVIGIASLTGIGFTMSLFLAGLAFGKTEHLDLVRQAILIGSLFSAALGISLFLCQAKKTHSDETEVTT